MGLIPCCIALSPLCLSLYGLSPSRVYELQTNIKTEPLTQGRENQPCSKSFDSHNLSMQIHCRPRTCFNCSLCWFNSCMSSFRCCSKSFYCYSKSFRCCSNCCFTSCATVPTPFAASPTTTTNSESSCAVRHYSLRPFATRALRKHLALMIQVHLKPHLVNSEHILRTSSR